VNRNGTVDILRGNFVETIHIRQIAPFKSKDPSALPIGESAIPEGLGFLDPSNLDISSPKDLKSKNPKKRIISTVLFAMVVCIFYSYNN